MKVKSEESAMTRMKNAVQTALKAGPDTTVEDELIRLSEDDPNIIKDLKN